MDSDIIILTPDAPLTPVIENFTDWDPGSRCAGQGATMFTVPIPSGFIVPSSHTPNNPDGTTPNACSAILGSDGHTIFDSQPFCRCTPGQPATSHHDYGKYLPPRTDLFGLLETGAHGGSGLSSLGGTIRLGELVRGGRIPHAIKFNIDASNFSPTSSGFRWPARKSDRDGAGYTGSVPQCRMGSLLALKPDFYIDGLESEPGKILALCLQNHGGYICDSSGQHVFGVPTEFSPSGRVDVEFQQEWGFPINSPLGSNGWARDLVKIWNALHVVDSWDLAQWAIVSASNGTMGVGGGSPRVPWAPPIGSPPPPAPPPAPPPPPPGPPPPGAAFDQIVVVAMENRNRDDVIHHPNAPFLSSLADSYSFCRRWRGTTNPSQPNYIDVIGGSTFGIAGNGNHPNLDRPTIVDVIEATGRTWKAIAQGASGTGAGLRPPRGEDHFPFLSYRTITGSLDRAANMIPGDHTLAIAHFNAGVNFIWYTPTDQNNMHSTSTRVGDDYLASWIPQLLAAMAGKRALLLIWWDEAYTSPPYIPLIFAGTAAKRGFISDVELIHPSLIKLLETVWGGGNLGQRDVTANAPTDVIS